MCVRNYLFFISALSEPETQALNNHILSFRNYRINALKNRKIAKLIVIKIKKRSVSFFSNENVIFKYYDLIGKTCFREYLYMLLAESLTIQT